MPHQTKLTPDQEADVVRKYESGMSTAEVAELFDLSSTGVAKIVRRNGGEVRARHANRITTPEQDAEIARLYAEGMRTTQLAAQFNVPKQHIVKAVKRLGGEARRKGPNRLSEEQEQELVALYESGVNTVDLAAQFGVYTSTVVRVVRRLQGEVKSQWRRPPRVFSDEEIQRMAALWRGGKSQHAIAQEIGTTQLIVSRVLRQAGVESVSGRRNEMRGADNHRFKGGRFVMPDGYVWVLMDPEHPLASMRNRAGYVLEHRLVMAESLGRPLDPTETVHHIDGNRSRNELSNLQLRQGRHGKGVVATCLDCGSHNIGTAPIADHG